MPRTSRLLAPLLLGALLAACGGSSTQGTDQTPAPSGGAAATSPTTQDKPWPIKTRMHLDLWLHGFAMIQDDTAQVPYFKRGYRDAMVVRKNQQGVTTLLDANRDRLRARLAANPALVQAQFLALYENSWEELAQDAEWFLRAEGDPSRASNQQVQAAIAGFAQYFPNAADREWLRLFMQALEDERGKFYQAYWTQTQRERTPVLAAADSVWQLVARPKLQGYLNNTQQANGEVLASLPLDGEGRTVLGGKRTNRVSVNFPERVQDAADLTYTFVHETAIAVAASAVNDHTTPAEKREGLADRYVAAGTVLGGHFVLRKLAPELAAGYARYYLRAAGKTAPAGDPTAALESAFPLPAAIRDAIRRQLEITSGGI